MIRKIPFLYRKRLNLYLLYLNHYKTLKLQPTATDQQIKQSFLKLAKQLHPDSQNTQTKTPQQFIKLKEAYDILKETQSRREYDRVTFGKIQQQSLNPQNFRYYRNRETRYSQQQKSHHSNNILKRKLRMLALLIFLMLALNPHLYMSHQTLQKIKMKMLKRSYHPNLTHTQQQELSKKRIKIYQKQIKEKGVYGRMIQVGGLTHKEKKRKRQEKDGLEGIQGVRKQVVMIEFVDQREEYI